MDKEVIEVFESQSDVIENMEMFADMVIRNKMKLRDRMGFEYKNRHYTFIRDE